MNERKIIYRTVAAGILAFLLVFVFREVDSRGFSSAGQVEIQQTGEKQAPEQEGLNTEENTGQPVEETGGDPDPETGSKTASGESGPEDSQDTDGKENETDDPWPYTDPGFEPIEDADENTYYIRVNRAFNTVTVYTRDEEGLFRKAVKAFVCSVGMDDGTPLGMFQTSDKYKWRPLYGDTYGQYAFRIEGDILFHSVPYEKKKKNSLEYEEYNKLGEAASMGCVRLSVADAKWLYDYIPSGTWVEIYDDEDEPGPLGKPTAVRIDENSKYRGWDPTDPDPKNPWKQADIGQTEAKTK